MIAPDLGSWTTKNTTESPIPRCHPSVRVWWLFEWDEKANRLEFRSLVPPVRIGREILPLELPSFKPGLLHGREVLRRRFSQFCTWNLAVGSPFVWLSVTSWTRSLESEFRSVLDVKYCPWELRSFVSGCLTGREVWRRSFAHFWTWKFGRIIVTLPLSPLSLSSYCVSLCTSLSYNARCTDCSSRCSSRGVVISLLAATTGCGCVRLFLALSVLPPLSGLLLVPILLVILMFFFGCESPLNLLRSSVSERGV
jgi:hypothetical protein